MNLQIFLLAACAVLAVCTGVLAGVCIKRKKDINGVSGSIYQYLEQGTVSDFSTQDNYIARLQNAVLDLETQLEREKANTREKSRLSAQFISDVSHQLKTPLAGLRLYCEMEHASNPTEHSEKELLLIEKMENLVSKLLKLEKLRSDSYVMEFKTYDAADFINPLIDDFRHLFPRKRYIVSAAGSIRGDREWLGEAVGNLIKNASEHTAPDAAVEVCVKDEGGFTEITVQDNGGGVQEKELPLLFTRFHKTANALPSGAGIGLAITKAVVEKHHGTVSAENKNGGLYIVICLPHIEGYVAF